MPGQAGAPFAFPVCIGGRSMARAVKQDVDEVPSRFAGTAMIELHPVGNLLGAKPIRGSQLKPLAHVGTKLDASGAMA